MGERATATNKNIDKIGVYIIIYNINIYDKFRRCIKKDIVSKRTIRNLFMQRKFSSLVNQGRAQTCCISEMSASITLLLEKWFPLRGERAHSLKLFCMYDKRFEISKKK